jgi:hypothetical protein
MVPNPFTFIQPNIRAWKIVYLNTDILPDPQVKIILKTRNDSPSEDVPEKLYSSLKYEICQHISGSFVNKIPLLMSRIYVIHPDTGEEVQTKRKMIGAILKGNTEGALTHDQSERLSSRGKIQLQDVTFHHNKRYFIFQICYYLPSDLIRPVMVIRSAPFQVFARRQTGMKPRAKRKSSITFAKPQGILKKSQNSMLQNYLKGLEELIQMREKLKPELQKKALESALKKLVYTEQPHTVTQKLPPPPVFQQPIQGGTYELVPEIDINSLLADFGALLDQQYSNNSDSVKVEQENHFHNFVKTENL